jgi:putative tryptophan/tyrosine transport system substrate-binding protein
VRRRDFITLLGGAAAGPSLFRPLVARAQQPPVMRRIGWLDLLQESDPGAPARNIAFRQGMEKLGWVVGRNLAIDYRWGAFDVERARVAAAELLNLAPDVVICAGTPAALALQQATRTVPIVFTVVSGPVAQGIVASLAHPGANVTGFTYLEPSIGAKWLELLKQIAPDVTRVALVFNPDSGSYSRLFYNSIEMAAPNFAVQAVMAPVHETADVERVMTTLGREPVGGLVLSADAFIYTNRKAIIELAARHRLPAIYGITSTAAEGGLIFYCVDIVDQYRQAVAYVDRIFHGTKPTELPVQQPARFALTVNAGTARALGLTVPLALQVAADEVFE